MSKKSILKDNFNAIKVALKLIKNEEPFSEQNLEILNKFRGWGGVKSLLYPIDEDWSNLNNISKEDLAMEKDVKEFYRFIQDNIQISEENTNGQDIWQSIQESTLTSFYTPEQPIDQLFEKLKKNNPQIKSMLEPSAGSGRFVDAFINHFPDAEVTAVELDVVTALILKAKYINNEKVKIINSGFEKVDFAKQKFDIVASNIPFGNFPVYYSSYDKRITDKIHNFFFHHGINLLKEGGLLMYITSAGVFNSPNNDYIREQILSNTKSNVLIALPNNFFDETKVSSHLYIAEKQSNKPNDNYVNLKTDENKIVTNPLLQYIDKQTIEIATDPYGNLEYNYQMPMDKVLHKLDEIIFIPNLNIKEPAREINSQVIYERYPLGFENLDEVDFKKELELLRIDVPEQMQRNFSVLGTIKANYRGKIIPIATVSRLVGDTTDNKRSYLIDSYIYNDELYKPIKSFIFSKEFIDIFELKFIPSLQQFAKDYNLKIELDTRKTEPSNNFRKYFFDKFTQPYIPKTYQFEIYNNLHRPAEVNMVVLNENGVPAKINNIFVENNVKLYELEEVKFSNNKHKSLITDYLKLYSAYNQYISVLKGDNKAIIKIHNTKLNTVYDNFVKLYGYINENKLLINRYDKYFFSLLASLELLDDTKNIDLFTTISSYTKADIFKLPSDEQKNFTTPDEALYLSLGIYGCVDLEYISKQTNIAKDEVLNAIKEKIIFNPINKTYELRNIFLSGDIYQKISEIEVLDEQNEYTRYAIEELRSVVPEPIPYHLISKQFGNRWIPVDVYKDFLQKHFTASFDLNIDVKTDTFTLGKGYNTGERYITQRFLSTRFITPELIAENAFYNTYPIVTYTEGEKGFEKTFVDQQATDYYKREITRLRSSFENYLNTANQALQDRLHKIYNETYNSTVVTNFDGNMLNFDEFDLKSKNISQIYSHQKNAVWKMIVRQGGIVDHEVGLGKTLTMIAQAHFLKKFNVAKKPIIIGLKANISDIAKDYQKLLPNARILFATEKDYEQENRETFLNKIKNNDWDAVIMTHEQFGKIPQSLVIQLEITREELENVTDNLYRLEDTEVTRKQVQGLVRRKKSLEIKIRNLIEKINVQKDEGVLEFEDLGIDHIIVDESHYFKNLMFQTRHQRVAGLGNTQGSQRATNLLTAIRSLQKKTPSGEMGATFYSGTPISNSLTELYLLHRYLTPKTLENKTIQNFDSWAANFTKKTIEFETNMVNEVVGKERFRYYENLPELASMYCNIAHVMTGDVAGIDRPRKDDTLLLNEQTPSQRRFYKKLSKFLKDGDQSKLKLETPINVDEFSQALSLVAMNLAYKASLDMRLINSKLYKDEPNSKIQTLIADTLEYYHQFEEQKGTQIIFCDVSPSEKKLSFKELEENYQNGVFTSLYDDIKYKLIKGGIKEDEIAFIQHYNSQNKKAQLSKLMNEGKIRVLLGGTQNAGTGLNVQTRLVSIKHLSIPWKPSEIEQRNGRGFRAGNWICKAYNNDKIDIKMCATKNTLDAYKVDLNKNKSTFIAQIKSAGLGTTLGRNADEGVLDEHSGMNLAEFHAQITGDNTLLEKFKVDKRIKELEQEKSFVMSEVEVAQSKINASNKRIEELNTIISYCQRDLEKYKSNVQFDEKGTRINKPNYYDLSEIDSQDDDKVFEFLKLQMELISKKSSFDIIPIGEMYGFELVGKNNFMSGVTFVIRNKENPNVSYDITGGKMNKNDKNLAISYFIRCFDAIQRKIDGNVKNIDKEKAIVVENEKKLAFTFDKDDELEELKRYGIELEDRLKDKQKEEFTLPYRIIEKNRIYIVEGLDVFEKALEEDFIGSDEIDKRNNLFVSDDICKLMEQLAENPNSTLDIFYNVKDDETGLNLLGFTLDNYDKMYSEYYVHKDELLANIEQEKGVRFRR